MADKQTPTPLPPHGTTDRSNGFLGQALAQHRALSIRQVLQQQAKGGK